MKIAIVFAFLACALVSAERPEMLGDRPIEVSPNRIIVESRNGNDRIIGGMTASRGEFPYQVSLRRLGSVWFHTCGGSILNSRAVLTAAHCVDDLTVPLTSYKVVAGGYDVSDDKDGQTIEVASIVIHPNWDASNINNDVAVIRLKSDIKMDANAQPITLADTTPPAGTASTVSGWGWTDYDNQIRPNLLQKLDTKVQSEFMSSWHTFFLYKGATQVGAYISNGKGVCKGDSGGPLVSQVGGKPVQYGIVSYGMTPCAEGRTDIYTRVSTFKGWIVANS